MKPGKCALCHEFKPLQVSHLIPQRMFKYARTVESPRLTQLESGRAPFTTDKQPTAHLLCQRCEGRFNEKGERWVISQSYQGKGRFRLRDTLRKTTPISDILDHDVAFYPALSVPGVEPDQLTYFAVSIFWRASVFPFKDARLRTPLGRYQEEFRRFLLLDDQPFPDNATLLISVDNHEAPVLALPVPSSRNLDGYWRHLFYCQGILYALLVGQGIPQTAQDQCIVRSPQRYIGLSQDTLHDYALKSFQKQYKAALEMAGRTKH